MYKQLNTKIVGHSIIKKIESNENSKCQNIKPYLWLKKILNINMKNV